jgi:hypothetical protein
MKLKLTIQWGPEGQEPVIETYEFDTELEMNAFIKGMESARLRDWQRFSVERL